MVAFSDFNVQGDKPVYIQIVEYVKIQIHLGHARSGDELPSRRDLAGTLGINPNTVQKAYKQLESEGLLQTGNNVKSVLFVSDRIKLKIEKELTKETALKFIEYAKSLNMSYKETIVLMSKLWE